MEVFMEIVNKNNEIEDYVKEIREKYYVDSGSLVTVAPDS